ncbi:MAG: AAA family ATPase [Lentimicrobium sp.]|nr:AAA family ATPase [Lentimicrobium sp.]
MKIGREILNDLKVWKDNPGRKPLILQGARQVGKTWILKHFGEQFFENTAYFNFDLQTEIKDFFEKTKDPVRIIEFLSIINGRPILPGITLIIFDEIQECNAALNSLKYFNEEHPEYVIAGAGSLLGVALSRGSSFPVGNVEFLEMYPLTFKEFLSVADVAMYDYLNSLQKIEPIPEIFFSKLTDKLKLYFISGGMPEAVAALLGNRDTQLCQRILQNIINAYSLDFSKHIDTRDVVRVNYVWSSLPSQLSRENKKFLYQTVKPGARAREYEDALTWLVNAGLVYKIHRIMKPGLPLKAYEDLTAFKIYLSDTAVLRRLSLLDPVAISEGNRLFTEFKGSLTENFVLNSIIKQFKSMPYYWRSGNEAEVDFIVQFENTIIPIEVKSDQNIKSRSLSVYREKYNPEISIRFSLRNLKKEEGLINLPLFMADYVKSFLD